MRVARASCIASDLRVHWSLASYLLCKLDEQISRLSTPASAQAASCCYLPEPGNSKSPFCMCPANSTFCLVHSFNSSSCFADQAWKLVARMNVSSERHSESAQPLMRAAWANVRSERFSAHASASARIFRRKRPVPMLSMEHRLLLVQNHRSSAGPYASKHEEGTPSGGTYRYSVAKPCILCNESAA